MTTSYRRLFQIFFFQGDAGVTGRKIIVDTYGGWGAHGGGAFSGKDYTKVDRSAAYAARWVAKSLVNARLCRRVLVQVRAAESQHESPPLIKLFLMQKSTQDVSKTKKINLQFCVKHLGS